MATARLTTTSLITACTVYCIS